MAKLIDGKKIAQDIRNELAEQIVEEGLEPQLAVILVGTDEASVQYIKLKEAACRNAGIKFHKYLIDDDVKERDILNTVQFLNKDEQIDAILIQLPLPKQYNQNKIVEALDYRKDVDGFHSKNIERYLDGKKQNILPGLSLAVWNLIAATGEYENKKALIIAKSPHFTEPTQKLLADQGVQTEIALPNDPKLKSKTKKADILVSASGRTKSITADMIKDGAIVIDVGINKKHRETVGDVDFKAVEKKASHITPVPGGVGPMTVAMLLFNTVILARLRKEKNSA